MNWDDLRAFLALARLGSLRRAAETLGVTQPTVQRRIRMLEADLGLPLFVRERDGHRLTAAGATLLPEARGVETMALRVEQRSSGLSGRLAETVRVSAGEWPALLLARRLAAIGDGPRIELVVTEEAHGITRREPDIVVRHGMPESGGEVTRRVGTIDVAVYCHPSFAEGRAVPLDPADLATLPWLGFVEEQQDYRLMRWLAAQRDGRPLAARLMRTDLMADAAAGGVGVAVLPRFLGDHRPGLMRLSPPIEALRADYWIVAHAELSRNPSVRAAMDWILGSFRATELGPQVTDGQDR
jgi:DNA-binding transcriptional LysR family regulator